MNAQPGTHYPKGATIVALLKTETLIRWHRASFRSFSKWKSRSPGDRVFLCSRSWITTSSTVLDMAHPERVCFHE